MPNRDLFSSNYKYTWPGQSEFPINNETHERQVKDTLLADIGDSEEYLIVTGFTSLANLVEIFGAQENKLTKLRIVLGFEPDAIPRKRWPTYNLTNEVKNYWLRQGISIVLGGSVLNLIELIKCGKIEFRLLDKLHAKIYVGAKHAVLGSANFSKNGLTTQQEANIRVPENGTETEAHQFREIKLLAENFYDMGEDYNERLLDLLDKLLQDVTWQEALARAVAEITEGEWLKEYPDLYKAIIDTELWPSQRMGIAKAMYVIYNQGNVLVADPTGSGKTKLCTALAYTLFHWLLANGKKGVSNALIVSPKQIMKNWKDEEKNFKLFNNVLSMGMLSTTKEANKKAVQADIGKASILIIDEAHNYLNRTSLRSKSIVSPGFAHTILSTATPINKNADDLLRLIELLDIDNLSDEDLDEYIRIKSAKTKKYDEAYINKLRAYINQFIIRRTKRRLNELIEKEPGKYCDADGKPCKYPKTISKTYKTGETEDDKKIALEITALCGQLKGINYLQKLKLPEFLLATDEDKQRYISQRIRAASALAAHTIKSSLRSSRCALMETLAGSAAAMSYYRFQSVKSKTGNVIQRIIDCHKKLPNSDFSDALLPDWLKDEKRYNDECRKEIGLYTEILALTKKLSDARDRTKAELLKAKAEQYGKLLVFDSTILTLDFLKQILCELCPDVEIIVASGQSEKNKDRVKEVYGRRSHYPGKVIALCSDAMSEGINLQDAKAMVLLDTPSVLRKIEQRIGRLERMDSEHQNIHVYWPDDSKEFSLNGDRRLIETLVMTDNLIGNNVDIPKVLYDKYLQQSSSTKNFIKAYEEFADGEFSWEGIKDNFQTLYDLAEGKNAVIDKGVYDEIKSVEAIIKTRVSFIESDATWSFFAIRGDSTRSPKWYFINNDGKATTDFAEISDLLRQHLVKSKVKQEKWILKTDQYLQKAVKSLRRKERDLLPNKKKRALYLGQRILAHRFSKETDLETKRLIQYLLNFFDIDELGEQVVDFSHFADLWLELLHPILAQKRKAQIRQRKIISLRDIKPKDVLLSHETLQHLKDSCQFSGSINEMIVSCIIAYKPDTEQHEQLL